MSTTIPRQRLYHAAAAGPLPRLATRAEQLRRRSLTKPLSPKLLTNRSYKSAQSTSPFNVRSLHPLLDKSLQRDISFELKDGASSKRVAVQAIDVSKKGRPAAISRPLAVPSRPASSRKIVSRTTSYPAARVAMRKPPTKPITPSLSTATRAHARRAFDSAFRIRTARMDDERERIAAERERVETQRMRQATVHRPEPIKRYAPLVIKRAHRVTVPSSPQFTARRTRPAKDSSADTTPRRAIY